MPALQLLAAYLLGTIAVSRATRLVVHDKWPPIASFRAWWINQTEVKGGRRGSWGVLVECPFCAAPYIAAVTLAVAIAGGVWSPDLTTVHGWWWTLAVWASSSYLAAMLELRDEPAEE